MTKPQRRTLARILAGGGLYLLALLLPLEGWPRLIAFLAPYGTVGWDVLWRALRNLLRGRVFDENFLMALATIGALAVGEYQEAVFVMLFYQVGELFQRCAVDRSRRSIAALMDIRPDWANLERPEGVERVDPEEVAVGRIILVKAGERIPLDGVVLEGRSGVDTAALTGESLPRQVEPGDEVVSGCVNLTGLLRVRVTKPFEESTVSRILELAENAAGRKARAENFITRFARIYTPAVVLAAAALTLLPPLLTPMAWTDALRRALNFLVVSCPCALVISVPLSFFGGIGGASRKGILVKGGNYLEALARTETVVFDKTGTLTRGELRVSGVYPQGCGREELLELAALAECWSEHPISRSLRQAWGGSPDRSRVGRVEELPGRGVRAEVDGRTVWVGSGRLMEELGVARQPCPQAGAAVHVAAEGRCLGSILLSDQVKPGAREAVAALRRCGVKRIVMLTGDARAAGEAAAAELGLDEVHAQLLPADKVERVEALLAARSPRGTLAFVGDGVNDAPVLARADVGIAMGAMGSDAAIEAADVVLMDDRLERLPQAIAIARRTLAIVRQNIVFALGVKLLVLVLSALGMANLWEAVFADVGVSVLAILNAMRTLRT